MRLFAGLGNPGREHANQRHNIGFMAVDAIADRHRAPPFRPRFQGWAAETALAGERIVILKPTTFMNDSGRSVREAARFYKIDLADITVFHDELDLAPGVVRVKVGGGNAGHNGLRSITAEIGNDYRRVRLGIGHPGSKDLVLRHVLGDFSKSDAGWLAALRQAVAEGAADLVSGRINGFQNKIHLAMGGLVPLDVESR